MRKKGSVKNTNGYGHVKDTQELTQKTSQWTEL